MSGPSPQDLSFRLAVAVGQVARRLRLVYGELAAGHYSILATLIRQGPQRPSDLARVERVSAPTMTRLLGTLEERGMVTRQPDADDARCVTVEVTAAGSEAVDQVRTDRAVTMATLLDTLEKSEVARLADALTVLESLGEVARQPT